MRVVSEIRLVCLPCAPTNPDGSVTAYALLADGWHTKTFETADAGAVVELLTDTGYTDDDPAAWPLADPE